MSKLSRVERKILANQFKILELLEPDRAEDYAEFREVVERGFEAEYQTMLQNVYDDSDIVTIDECQYVGDVLQMYDMMQTAFKKGENAGVDVKRLKFPGFDGNNETKLMSYAQHMRDHGKWTFLDIASQDFNSHFPTASKYSKMLAEWTSSADKYKLTAADIVRILG